MSRQTAGAFAVACTVLLACLPAAAQVAPGLEVSSLQSNYVPGWSSRRSLTRQPGEGDPSYRSARFELSAVFRNTGPKAITSVSWEFLFFKDARQTEVMLGHEFRDGKRIPPGEEVRLKHSSLRGAATEHKAVRVTRVVYADGTVWQAARVKH